MRISLFAIAAVSVVLILNSSLHSQATSSLGSKDRIIRADRPAAREFQDEDEAPAVEILYIGVATRNIEINKVFVSDDNWLSDLQIGIKNISRHTITCVGVSFGVLAEIDTKLKTHESWPWGLGFYRGDCDTYQKTSRTLKLAPGDQTVLDSTDIPKLYGHSLKKMGGLAKAVFHKNTWIRFKGKKPVELPISFSKGVRFLDDDSY